ncbi:amidase family protein [Gammaproteobacteria bacterium]|nr:amidase family protein [Gammaproteobacteria bacterium]
MDTRKTKIISKFILSIFMAWGFLSAVNFASGQNPPLLEITIDEVHSSLSSGQITCRSLVEFYLERIEAFDQQGPILNSIQHINEAVLDEADALDLFYSHSGFIGPLHCIPVLLKDQVEVGEMPTTYGSAVFAGFVSGRDATIVSHMKEAGAIIIAKTTMGEFASRYIGSAFGIARNAYDPTRNPSGSSAGTGIGVAANFGLIGIGEDTGGSIRGPASVHNLVGLRPTVPLVSRFGMMPANPTNDTLGPITRTVTDAAILLDVIAGYDSNDPVTAYSVGNIPNSYRDFLVQDSLRGARIGVIRQSMDPSTNPESEDFQKVRDVIDLAIEKIESLGAILVDPAEFPLMEIVHETYGNNNYETEEAINEYLANLPGSPVSSLREILLQGKVTPWRASDLMGVIGRSTQDPGYLQFMLARETIREAVLAYMAEAQLDALIYATFDHQTTLIAPDALSNSDTKDAYGRGNNRRLSPLVAFPAITVPAGFTVDGLPVGIEMLGRAFSEGMLLGFAYDYEQSTNHRKPPSSTPSLE